MSQKNRYADSTNRADFLSEIGMGKSNLQASLEKKYAAWSGELLEVQKQILKIEESHAELSQLRTRAAKLEELVGNAKSIFFEVNPEWDGDQVKPLRPGSYTLPFEIGTVSKECMTILREQPREANWRRRGHLISLDSKIWSARFVSRSGQRNRRDQKPRPLFRASQAARCCARCFSIRSCDSLVLTIPCSRIALAIAP